MPDLTDQSFDKLVERFKTKIAYSTKGRLRFHLLWQHLEQVLPSLMKSETSWHVLELGAGLGDFALALAQANNELLLNDSAQPMLDEAKLKFDKADLHAEFVVGRFQEVVKQLEFSAINLVVCHAVLEWLANPRESLISLASHMSAGSYLSLSFYNRDALKFYNLQKGNFNHALLGQLAGQAGGLTPISPIRPAEFEVWLTEAGLDLVSVRGVRVIYDYLRPEVRQKRTLEQLLDAELAVCDQLPFRALGRYQHYILQKS